MTKQKIANRVLWIAFILALVASLIHMSWVFGNLEFGRQRWLGWLPAIAINTSLAALAYTIQQRKLAQRSTRDLWLGVIGLIGVGAFANLLYALAVQTQDEKIVWATFGEVDFLDLFEAISMSAILPVLVVYLGNVAGADDAMQPASYQQALADTGILDTAEVSATQSLLSRWKPALRRAISAAQSRLAFGAPSPNTQEVIDEMQPSQQAEEMALPAPGLPLSVEQGDQTAAVQRTRSHYALLRHFRDFGSSPKRHRITRSPGRPSQVLQRRMKRVADEQFTPPSVG